MINYSPMKIIVTIIALSLTVGFSACAKTQIEKKSDCKAVCSK
jgi:general stress protein CsbA